MHHITYYCTVIILIQFNTNSNNNNIIIIIIIINKITITIMEQFIQTVLQNLQLVEYCHL